MKRVIKNIHAGKIRPDEVGFDIIHIRHYRQVRCSIKRTSLIRKILSRKPHEDSLSFMDKYGIDRITTIIRGLERRQKFY